MTATAAPDGSAPTDPERPYAQGEVLAGLVVRAAGGSDECWAELVDRFAATVIAIARQYRLSEPDVDDVAQVVWLRLAENLGRIRQPSRIAGWLAATTRNEALRVVKRRAKLDPLFEVDVDSRVPAVGPSAATQVVQNETMIEVATGFALLDERCRVLLRLVVVDEQDYAVVAEQLAIPVGSIGPTRRRCLDKLRTLIDGVDPSFGESEVV